MSELTISFLDVGQGDGTVIVTPNGKVWIVDLGSKKNGKITWPETEQYFENVLHFKKGGANAVAAIFLTHPDGDHINLIGKALDTFQLDVGHVYYSGQAEQYVDKTTPNCQNGHQQEFRNAWISRQVAAGASVTKGHLVLPCRFASLLKCKGTVAVPANAQPDGFSTWLEDMLEGKKATALSEFVGIKNLYPNEGGAQIQLLASSVHSSFSRENTASLVLRVWFKKKAVILMGDATYVTERRILEEAAKSTDMGKKLANSFPCHVLKLGHHGSAITSTSEEWAAKTSPEWIFISADRHGMHPGGAGATGFRHPAQAAIDTMLQFSESDETRRDADQNEHIYIAHYDNDKFFGASRSCLSFDEKGKGKVLEDQTFKGTNSKYIPDVKGKYYEVRTKKRIYTSVARLDEKDVKSSQEAADLGFRYDITLADKEISLSASDDRFKDVKHIDASKKYWYPGMK
jgi:beta-lactamase superfamily II metal-dependent hydrolase